MRESCGHAARGIIVVVVLSIAVLLGAVAVPASASAIKKGRYVGRTTAGVGDESLSFKVTKKKGKLKIKAFKMDGVVESCTVTPFPGTPGSPSSYLTVVQKPLPFGGGKIKKAGGTFSLSNKYAPNEEEIFHAKATGTLAGGTAQGLFDVTYKSYSGDGSINCTTTPRDWSAVRSK